MRSALFVSAVFALATTTTATNLPVPVVGYLPEWRQGGFDYHAAAPHLTHIILFSLEVAGSGSFEALDRLPSAERLAEARAALAPHGTKLMVSFGGFGRTNGFPRMAQDPFMRRRFINNVQNLLDAHSLDGLDLNWEYPANESEWRALAELCSEAAKMLRPKGRQLSVAYYPDSRQERILKDLGIINSVDFALSMSYDAPGRHSSRHFADQTLRTWRKLELPVEKLCLGVPFYARHIRTGEAKAYYELAGDEDGTLAPDVDEVDEFAFNGRETLAAKAATAASVGAGVMIWEIGHDVSSIRGDALLHAVAAGVRKGYRGDEKAREL